MYIRRIMYFRRILYLRRESIIRRDLGIECFLVNRLASLTFALYSPHPSCQYLEQPVNEGGGFDALTALAAIGIRRQTRRLQ